MIRHITLSSVTETTMNRFDEGPGQFDRLYTRAPRWYNVKAWGKKIWLGIVVAVIILIIIIAVAVVETNKKNKYPDYSKLTYSVSETCKPPF